VEAFYLVGDKATDLRADRTLVRFRDLSELIDHRPWRLERGAHDPIVDFVLISHSLRLIYCEVFTKSTPREEGFASISSQRPRNVFTLRLQVARTEQQLLEMGKRISELKERLGLRQQFIADSVGVTLRQYQYWQAGKHQPQPEHMQALAKVLETTTAYLLNGDPPTASVDAELRAQLDRIEQKLDLLLDRPPMNEFAARRNRA
jgi:transcriptional regulator with XRE-family HTH domain